MSVLYVLAGINHFRNPDFYLKIMPNYIPLHSELVVLSGICEIILGILLLFNKTRNVAGWLIIAMLIAFMPVHIQMIIDYYGTPGKMFVVSLIRLPLQFVLIWWAYKMREVKI